MTRCMGISDKSTFIAELVKFEETPTQNKLVSFDAFDRTPVIIPAVLLFMANLRKNNYIYLFLLGFFSKTVDIKLMNVFREH